MLDSKHSIPYTQRMTEFNPYNPERNVTQPYPSAVRPKFVFKIYDDPDFIQLSLRDRRSFDIRWATNANHVQSVDQLSELIEQSYFTQGTISLRHSFERTGTVSGGANILEGDAEDILNEVKDAGDRVIGYSLSSKALQLSFQPSWPRTYHDIHTNEIILKMSRRNKMARAITDQAISLTAMEGLRSSTDQTLNEFSQYLPAFKA